MEILGVFSLIVFFGITIGSIKGWIPQDVLPIQTSLTLGAVFLWVLGLAFDDSLSARNFAANIYLHPISAVIAGFLVAGALEAAGGFTAAMALLEKVEKTRLGLAGAVVLLVNFPNIFSMPCGRIWVVALFPLAVMFGYSIARKKNNPPAGSSNSVRVYRECSSIVRSFTAGRDWYERGRTGRVPAGVIVKRSASGNHGYFRGHYDFHHLSLQDFCPDLPW